MCYDIILHNHQLLFSSLFPGTYFLPMSLSNFVCLWLTAFTLLCLKEHGQMGRSYLAKSHLELDFFKEETPFFQPLLTSIGLKLSIRRSVCAMSLKCLTSRSRELNSIPREKIKSYETTIVSYCANTYPFFSIKNKYLDILIFVSFYKNDYGSSRKQKKSLLLLKTPSLHVIYCLLWEERRGFIKNAITLGSL